MKVKTKVKAGHIGIVGFAGVAVGDGNVTVNQ